MNSQKKIEVNQSSLLSLRAELLRKKQEVHEAKISDIPNKHSLLTKAKLKTKLDRANDGVSERNRKDGEEIDEENEILHKSQSALEAKSKLYDDLLKRKTGIDSSNFLVDFKNKEDNREANNAKEDTVADESEEEKYESDFDDDEEWVDFVDCLGRTKRCHRDDLESMKANDEKLRVSLFGHAGSREKAEQGGESREQGACESEEQLELCSEDMRREMLRQKWEKEERELLDRKDIHYQHVLFDEARSHGVGYYSFSTDEAERARQLEQLKNLRKETLEQQAVTQEAAARKKKQMKERLRAARRRKRERLGLPPEEEPEDSLEEEEPKPEQPEELKREVQQPTTVRPWDLGKEKGSRILTQEEWIERKREERQEEFAPPQSLLCERRFEPRRKKMRVESEERSLPEAYLEDMKKLSGQKASRPKETAASAEEESDDDRRGVGSEVPPPPTFELYGPSSRKSQAGARQPDIEKSIEEGLNFIRKQVERRQALETKGFMEIL